MIGMREEGARIRENWLVNWKTGINLCISYSQKLVNQLLVYQGITVFGPLKHALRGCYFDSKYELKEKPKTFFSEDI
jgi:hypothetical protein